MPLIISGIIVDKLPSDTASFFELYPSLRVRLRRSRFLLFDFPFVYLCCLDESKLQYLLN